MDQFESGLLFSMTRDVIQPGFLKVIRILLDDHYIDMFKDNPRAPALPDMKFRSETSVPYVGTKSYGSQTCMFTDGKHLFTKDCIAVAINMKTRKTANLNKEWKQKTLKHIEENGWTNNLPIEVKPLERHGNIMFSFVLTIHHGHLDSNQHTNYKVYIFGTIVCIRQAILLGKLSNYADLVPDDVIIREICMIFENESLKETSFVSSCLMQILTIHTQLHALKEILDYVTEGSVWRGLHIVLLLQTRLGYDLNMTIISVYVMHK